MGSESVLPAVPDASGSMLPLSNGEDVAMGNAFPGSGTPFPANLGRKIGKGKEAGTRLDGVKNSIIMILFREEEISLADARSRRQRRAAALAPLAAPAHRATLPSRSRPHTS